MLDYSHIQKPDLGYRYEFATDELDAMDECLEAHGFAIIKDALPPEIVAKLKQAVWDGTDPDRTLQPGESRTRHAWIESGPGAWEVLDYEPFMEIHRHLIGTDELTLHRSAAIIRPDWFRPCSVAYRLVRLFDRDQALGRRSQPRAVAVGQVVLPDRVAARARRLVRH